MRVGAELRSKLGSGWIIDCTKLAMEHEMNGVWGWGERSLG